MLHAEDSEPVATSRQLRWNGREWGMAIDGHYAPGYWRLSLRGASVTSSY